MGNPVLVEAVRGRRLESSHCGAVAVVDGDGRAVLSLGDIDRPVYPRSAVKALQALPLIETGAADRYAFADEELALACASHGGEPAHIATAERMLTQAGLAPTSLACGPHWPLHQPAAQALARAGGMPLALHNNCSGKHAGFLCVACTMGMDKQTYTDPAHPVQRGVKAVLESLMGVPLDDDNRAVDGCSVPTWAVPLWALALAFARFGSGLGMLPVRAAAASRLRQACANRPWHVAGTGRFCTIAMERLGERVFVKTGAEGMFCAALPEQGLGLAVKCDDGAGRAAEVAMAALIARFAALDDADRSHLDRFVRPSLRNWNGIVVGELRPTPTLL